MKRNVSLADISDGRLYGENDMVKADCRGCQDCYRCCTGMGRSVVLDPYDIFRLQQGLGMELKQLLAENKVELNVVDGVILPNLRMAGADERCAFLDDAGRCSIHESRPGICRLFPLGRIYENGDFKYFLQTRECEESRRTKVKVAKWVDTPNLGKYHQYLCQWHSFLNKLEDRVKGQEDSEEAKRLNLLLLQFFYLTPYEDGPEFYEQFQKRMESWG